MAGSSSIERAFMATRRLRNSVVHHQERAGTDLEVAEGEAVSAALLLLRRYLDHDYRLLGEYEAAEAS
jgi:hypothetical protein